MWRSRLLLVTTTLTQHWLQLRPPGPEQHRPRQTSWKRKVTRHCFFFVFVFVERFTKKISHLITEINRPNQWSSFKPEKWAGPRWQTKTDKEKPGKVTAEHTTDVADIRAQSLMVLISHLFFFFFTKRFIYITTYDVVPKLETMKHKKTAVCQKCVERLSSDP